MVLSPQLWLVWLESQDFASWTSETPWGSNLAGNSVGGISFIYCVLVIHNTDHSWGYCSDAQQFLADRTAELPWPCSMLQRKRSFLPRAPKEEAPALPQSKSTGTQQGCPAPDRYRTAWLTPLPNLPREWHLQSVWFAEILISPSSYWYQQGLQALGYWQIRAVSPARASLSPIYKRGSAS